MELYQLRHFVAVAETGSFTRGAERCHVTQPALSVSIARLEEDLGAKLFSRTRRLVSLTDAGQKLLADSVAILKACSEARGRVRGATVARVLRIGLLQTFPTRKLTALLSTLRVEFAGLEIQIEEGSASDLDSRLVAREIDVALTILTEGVLDSVGEASLFEERYVLFVSSTQPLAAKREIVLSDLNDQYLVVRTACEAYGATMALLRDRGVRTFIACNTEHDDRALELVRAGVGVALMPELFEMDGVNKVPVKDLPLSRTVGLRWAVGQNDELVDRFRTFARLHPWRAQ